MKIRIKFINGALVGLFSGLIGAGIWIIEHQRIPELFLQHPSYVLIIHTCIALVIGVLFRFFPSGRFNEEEIKTFNTLSLFKTIKWNDVASIKIINFLLLKYYLIYTPSSKWALWVPLTITNEKELIECMSNSKNDVVSNNAKT